MRYQRVTLASFILGWMIIVSVGWAHAQQATQGPTPSPIPQPQASSTPVVATQPSEVVPDQPAVPTVPVPSPASPQHASDQVMWALIASYVLENLKRSKWFPFIKHDTEARLQAAAGFVMALLTAVGINIAVNGSIFDQSGLAITFSGITWQAFKDIAWQWAAQQGWYDLIVKKMADNGSPR